MTVTTKPRDLRAHSRYQLAADALVPVCVEWTVDNESHKCEARLVDLSAGGARLRLAQPVTLRETVEVRLHVKKLSVDFRCAADVCWISPWGKEWVLGCAFACELPEAVLTRLADGGYIDRRADPRFTTSLAAEVKEELGASQWFQVTVDNYSSGGFRFDSDRPVSIGQRVLLRVEDADQQQVGIPGRALWQVDTDDGFAIGCSFLNVDGFDKLAAIASREEVQSAANEPKRSLKLSPLAWLSLVATVVVMTQHDALLATMHLLWQMFR